MSAEKNSPGDVGQRTLRIAIFAEYAGEGGPFHYLQRLTRFLVDEGHDLTVIPFIPDTDPLPNFFPDPSSVTFVRQQGWLPRLHRIFPRELIHLLEARAIARWVRKHPASFDVVIFSVCALGRFFWPRFGQSLPIYILHSYPKGDYRRASGFLFRRLLGRSAQIVPVSHHSAKQIEIVWGIRRLDPRIKIVPSTSGPIGPSPGDSGERDVFQVLMVGTVTEEKNPLLWIEIARKVVTETFEKPVVFRWIGDGPLKAECKRQIAEYALENQVVFAGFDPLPSTHYLASDIYLHVSSVETLSLAAIDSARFGVPGVVSATGGLPEIVSDGVTGFVVDSQDPDDFAGKISFLLRDSKLRQDMRDKARLHYASNFSEEAWNSSLRNLLNR